MQGFTLVEMAVVMVIIGLLMAAMAQFTSAMIGSTKTKATNTRLDAIKIAINNFAARNMRLPCPANSSVAVGAAGYGQEAITGTVCTGTAIIGAGINADVRGIIPWASLGFVSAEVKMTHPAD